MSVVTAMAKARYLSEEESKEILHNTIIELSTQLESMKAQVETSRLHIETLITQVNTSTAELQEVKAKNLETRTKFEKFVDAIWRPVKAHNNKPKHYGQIRPEGYYIEQNMYGIFNAAVAAAGMNT